MSADEMTQADFTAQVLTCLRLVEHDPNVNEATGVIILLVRQYEDGFVGIRQRGYVPEDAEDRRAVLSAATAALAEWEQVCVPVKTGRN